MDQGPISSLHITRLFYDCNRIMAETVKGRLGQELQKLSQLIEEAKTPYTEREKVTSKPRDGATRKVGARPRPRQRPKDQSCHSS